MYANSNVETYGSTPEIAIHYENMSMQYTEIFSVVKFENFQKKIFDIFLIFAQNIDCGYTLESPCQGYLALPIYVMEQK